MGGLSEPFGVVVSGVQILKGKTLSGQVQNTVTDLDLKKRIYPRISLHGRLKTNRPHGPDVVRVVGSRKLSGK